MCVTTLGIGFAQRQIGKLVTSYEEITQDGDTWTISIQASVKHGSVTFKLGEEVEETTPDGRKVRVRVFFFLYILTCL